MKRRFFITLIMATLLIQAFIFFLPTVSLCTISTLHTGSGPHGVAVDHTSGTAVVTNEKDNTVSIIDLAATSTTHTIAVGRKPSGVGINSSTSRGVVSNRKDNSVSIVDLSLKTVLATIDVGKDPEYVAINEISNKAYITNSKSDNVSVIDLSTNEQTALIAVGEEPKGIAVYQEGNKAIVANKKSDNVSIIDLATNNVIATLAVGENPHGVAIDVSSGKALIADTRDNTITLVDMAANSVVDSIAAGKELTDIAVVQGANRALITDSQKDMIIFLDLNLNQVLNEISVEKEPQGIAIHNNLAIVTHGEKDIISVIDLDNTPYLTTVPTGKEPKGVDVNPLTNTAIIANEKNDTISIFNLGTGIVTGSIPVAGEPIAVAVNPATGQAVVVSRKDDILSLIDLNSGTIITNMTTAKEPESVAINTATNIAIVAGEKEDKVEIFDLAAQSKVAEIQVGKNPMGIAVDSSLNKALATNKKDDTVSLIDLANLVVTNTITVGRSPVGAAINPETHLAAVINEKDDSVSIIDLATATIIATVPVGKEPNGIAVNCRTNQAVVANKDSKDLTIIDLAANTIIDTIYIGKELENIAVNPQNNKAVLTLEDEDSVMVLNLSGQDATAPVITITSHREGQIIQDSTITISGTVDDPAAHLYLNGVKTLPDNNGFSFTDLTLVPGENIFTIIADDPAGNVSETTSTITLNRPPEAGRIPRITLNEDELVPITLSGSDPDDDPLTYRIISNPNSGLLSGTEPNLTYTPNADFNGSDSLSFIVNDGIADSAPSIVELVIQPVNDVPVAFDGTAITDEDTSVAITLAGSDEESNSLAFHIVTPPINGTFSGTGPDLTYTPNMDFNGADSFNFTAKDGLADSSPATISITVNPVNDQPMADAGPDQTVTRGDTVALDGGGSIDIDGNSLSYQWSFVTAPAGSSATLANPTLANPTFVADVAGTYEAQLTVNDGIVNSATDSIMITASPRIVIIPDVIGLPQAEAEAAIAAAGLVIGALSSAHHDTVPNGSVIIQDPAAESSVEEGTSVDLILSLGPLPSGPPEANLEATPGTIQIGDSLTLTWAAINAQSAYIDNGIGAVPTNGSAIVSPEHTTTYTFTATGPEGFASAKVMVTVIGDPEPQPEGSFGAQYDDLVPRDATVESYDARRFSLITGFVQDLDYLPISDVFITIHQHPEYGTVATDAEGRFTIPVEGNGILTLIYQKYGLLRSQRQVYVPWNDIAIAETIQLIAEDPIATTLTFDGDSDTVVTHVSTEVSDEFGSRSATMVFTGDNMAYLTDEEGNDIQQLTTITTRATEFVTPESMPAVLPPASAYTYCVELAVDGAQRVRFAKPVTTWIDNFLGFDVGEIVPVGYYDRDRGVWVPYDNGTVVRLLDTNDDGIVDALDADGDDQPDDLDSNGSLANEVLGLDDPVRYAPDATFWRVAVTHFTPWDCNWPYGPPLDAITPNPPGSPSVDQQDDGTAPDDIRCTDSYINKRSRVYHEDIPIPGTDMTLHYASNRVEGYKTVISVPASGYTVPQSLNKIIVKVEVAGRTLEQTLDPMPNQKAEFVWDGKDHMGSPISGSFIKAIIRVDFEYDLIYYRASSIFDPAFSQPGIEVTSIQGREKFISWKKYTVNLSGNIEKKSNIAEGWTLSKHHYLNQTGFFLEKGDGTRTESHQFFIDTVAGNGIRDNAGDGGPAIEASFNDPWGVAVDGIGNLYIADSNNDCIRKVDTNGIIATVAGGFGLVGGFGGDGGPATEARLQNPFRITVDSAGNLYISDTGNERIRKVDVNGIITTIAGNGILGFSGDNGPATEAGLYWPRGLAVDNAGNLYIADSGNNRIRKVDINGIITTVAGKGIRSFGGDNGPATEAYLNSPSGVAVDGIGKLFIADTGNKRIRMVDINGIITTVAGYGISAYGGDGGPATAAYLNSPNGVVVDGIGNLYIADTGNKRIRKVDANGIITSVAGSGHNGYGGDGGPATEAWFTFPVDIAVDVANNLYIVDILDRRIRGMIHKQSLLPGGDIIYNDENGLGHIMSAAGLHQRSIDLETKMVLREFDYDQNNDLVAMTDQFGNRTTLQRDLYGVPDSITSPDGLVTALTIDADNHLIRITYPDSMFYSFEYTPDGLMTTEIESAGNQFDHLFDTHGRLTDVYDEEGGHWNYNRTVFDTGDILVQSQTAEGNTTSYLDHTYSTGEYESTVTDADGAQTLFNRSDDGLTVNKSLPCGMDLSYKYGLDPEYKYEFVKESSELAPSGLERITLNDKTYQDTDADYMPDFITETVSVNGKTTTLSNNVLQAQKIVTSPESRTVTINYDPATLVTNSIVTPGLFETSYSYDVKGRLASTTTNIRATSFGYNSQGFFDHVTDPENHTTSYGYDEVGRVTAVNRPDGSSLGFTYDLNGNMTILTNPILVNHGFGYNKVNLQSSYQSPLSGTYSYVYDRDRRLTRTNFPSGFQINNIYTNNQLTQIQTPEGNIDLSYLCSSKVGLINKGTESLAYGYDGKLLTSETLNGTLNKALAYGYNNDFNLTSFTYAGATNSYTYDNDGLLTSSGIYTIARNVQNGLAESVSGGELALTRTFDGYAEIEAEDFNVNGQNPSSWSTIRDNADRIITKTETVDGVAANNAYTYDHMGRLLTVSKDGALVEEYQYDANGTRIQEMNLQRGIASRSMTYSNEDHLLTAGSASYQYDADGFLVNKTDGSGTTAYNYSSRGELLSVNLPDGRVIEYVHDPLTRRIAKKVNGVVVEKYLWQGLTRLLAIYDGNENLLMRFEYADGRMPVAMASGGSTYYLGYNQVGSLRVVSDSAGNVVKRIDYDSFGNILSDTNPAFAVPFGFAGGLQDRDTGLVQFGARDYDPDTGRWAAKDPMLFAGGDTDLFGYVQNNPVNRNDPTGLYWFRQDWQEPGVVGRPYTIVPPEGPVSEFIEQDMPAGYTFGEMHDSFVGAATKAGIPDWLVNIPSMIPAYEAALATEVLRTVGVLNQPTPTLSAQPTPCK